MTVQLQRTHALETVGRSRICWIPGLAGVAGLWKAGWSLEAKMNDGFPDVSEGSGGI